MGRFDADELERVTGGCWRSPPQVEISGFAFDARKLLTGECFVALSSGSRDGHDFLNQAAASGASSAIVEMPSESSLPQLVVRDSLEAMAKIARSCRDAFGGKVIGVTGSSGKTSTKEMLSLLLGKDEVHATPGNWNNRIGVPMTLFGIRDCEHSYAVVEAGINQPGEMLKLGEMIAADVTIITNIGTAHLELLGTQKGIADEKSKLATLAKDGSPIILPAEVLAYDAFSAIASRCVAVSREGGKAHVSVSSEYVYRMEVLTSRSRMRVTLFRREDSRNALCFELASLSFGMAQNAVLAFVAGLELGLDPVLLAARIEEWRPGELRGNISFTGNGAFVYADCYNANPDSMVDALSTFDLVAPKELPRTYIIGAMFELGVATEQLHHRVAEKLVLQPDDCAIFVGPKNLTDSYLEGALSAGADASQLSQLKCVDSFKYDVARSKMALFLKGSRSVALERLLPGMGLVQP